VLQDWRTEFRYSLTILPKWTRRTNSQDALLLILYLRGISTGDFQEALAALLGTDAPNLSPAVVSKLTAGGITSTTEGRSVTFRRDAASTSGRRGVYLEARMAGNHGRPTWPGDPWSGTRPLLMLCCISLGEGIDCRFGSARLGAR
jgi:hypothetical protein